MQSWHISTIMKLLTKFTFTSVKMKNQKKIVLGVCLICFSITGFAFTGSGTPETMQVNLPAKSWSIADSQGNKNVGLTEILKKDDDINNWHELVSIVFLSYNNTTVGNSLNDYLQAQQTQLQQQCSNVQWKTLKNTPDSVTYQWQIKDCGTGIKADQVEIARIVKGQYGFNSIHYAVKTSQLSEQKKQEMLNVVNQASMVNN